MAARRPIVLIFIVLSLTRTANQEEACISDSYGGSCSVLTDSMAILTGGHAQNEVVNGSEDIFVSIKTTQKYHSTRLPPLLLTWLQTIHPHQVHIVTDVGIDDSELVQARNQGIGVMNSSCPANHHRKSLCCKSGIEFEQYYLVKEKNAPYRWFCHFDDDVYVNTQELVSALRQFSPATEPVYLGRWPLSRETVEASKQKLSATFPNYTRTTFRYATGAAYCISSFLMDKVEPYCRGAQLAEKCESMGYPDDVLIGAVIGAVLGFNLTNKLTINSNLNGHKRISGAMLKHQITISYGEFKIANREPVKNVAVIPEATFSEEKDPTRFLSYHCLLYPQVKWCLKI